MLVLIFFLFTFMKELKTYFLKIQHSNVTTVFRHFINTLYVKRLTPEEILGYIYALLHSPKYCALYAEFLKSDFPRIPFTSDVDLFRQLAAFGADLVALHLLQDDYPQASWVQVGQPSPLQSPITTFVTGVNGKTMGAFTKSGCYQNGKVFLDTSKRATSSYLDGVPEDVMKPSA